MEQMLVNVVGKILIQDLESGEVVLKKNNAVHSQHLSTAIGRALSGQTNGEIYKLGFGNGGTYFDSSSNIVFKTPNVSGSSTLYNQTYEVLVAADAPGVPASNSVIAASTPPPSTSTLITVTAVLSAAEPVGQAINDSTTTSVGTPYAFDEICLKTQDNLLLTHVIFSPIEKTANRAFLITYDLTISVA